MAKTSGAGTPKSAKSGGEIGAENVETLRSYLAALETEGRTLPRRAGRPNFSAIALACGFDRGVLYNNPSAKRLLELFDEKTPGTAEPEAEQPAVRTDRRDQRILTLEQQNASLRAENAGLREKLRRLEQVEDIMVTSGRRVSS